MFVGYYKGVQSFGAALSWIIEAKGTSYRAQLVICSCLAVFFIPPTYVVATCVQDKGGMAVAPDTDRNKTEMTQNRRYREDGSHSGRSQVSRSSQSQSNRSQASRSQANRSQASRSQTSSQRSARMASQKTPSARAVMTWELFWMCACLTSSDWFWSRYGTLFCYIKLKTKMDCYAMAKWSLNSRSRVKGVPTCDSSSWVFYRSA